MCYRGGVVLLLLCVVLVVDCCLELEFGFWMKESKIWADPTSTFSFLFFSKKRIGIGLVWIGWAARNEEEGLGLWACLWVFVYCVFKMINM